MKHFFGVVGVLAALSAMPGAFAQANAPASAPATAPASPQVSQGVRTAAIVNDAVISTFDLEQRVKLVLVTSGQQPSPEVAKRIRGQVLRTLIDEMLQMQEATKNKVQISEDDLTKSLNRIAQQNNTNLDQIYGMLDQNGVARISLQQQVRTELAWQKFVQGRIAPRITVSQEEVQSVLERTKANSNRAQFLVSEIFFSVDSPEQEAEIRKNASNVRDQLRAGAPFTGVARQFSQSASAATGGDIGWVVEGQLAPELDTELRKMRPGGISDLIRAAGGFYILAVRQKQSAAGTAPEPGPAQPAAAAPPPPSASGAAPKVKIVKGPSAQIGLAQVVIPLDPTATGAKLEAAKQKAVALFRGIDGCGNLSAVAKTAGAQAQVVGQLPFKDLQPEFRKIIEQTPNGRATPPMRSNRGIEMFVICSGGSVIQVERGPQGPAVEGVSTRVEPFKVPTKEDIENRLFNQQLSMLSRRHLRDLRRDATIEIREE